MTGITLLIDLLIMHSVKDRTPDPDHPYRRGYTLEYRAKKRIVYYF